MGVATNAMFASIGPEDDISFSVDDVVDGDARLGICNEFYQELEVFSDLGWDECWSVPCSCEKFLDATQEVATMGYDVAYVVELAHQHLKVFVGAMSLAQDGDDNVDSLLCLDGQENNDEKSVSHQWLVFGGKQHQIVRWVLHGGGIGRSGGGPVGVH
eukprot:6118489-Ditylum_brightwellii.AAC.1